MGLQMLLYLFTLEKHGAERYGKEIVPAGVLYVPARDILVRAGQAPLGRGESWRRRPESCTAAV